MNNKRTVVQDMTGVYVSKKSSPSCWRPPWIQSRALCLYIVPSGVHFHLNYQMAGNMHLCLGTISFGYSLNTLFLNMLSIYLCICFQIKVCPHISSC